MTRLLNYDLVRSTPVQLPRYQSIQLWCVGVGGTGSYLAVQLVNVAQALIDQGRQVSLHLCDPDWIEEKNTRRQNFSLAEVGLNKAAAMALRLSLCGKTQAPIYAYDQAFNPRWINSHWQQMIVLIGCVDSVAGRKAMSKVLEKNDQIYHRSAPGIWHIDAGNHSESGQVLIGSSLQLAPDYYQFNALGCFHLPAPIIQHPGLIEDDPEPTESCEQAALRHDQSISVNPMSATLAATYVRSLLSGTLRSFATYFDLASGQMNSKYIEASRITQLVRDRENDPRLKT